MPDDAIQTQLAEPEVSLAVVRAARRRRAILVSAAVLAAFVLWELCTTFVAYTSDAYVRSDLISIAPQVTGRIISVPIEDNQTVHRGDLLVAIDPEPFQLALNAAQASLRQAAAQTAADQDSLHHVLLTNDDLADFVRESVDERALLGDEFVQGSDVVHGAGPLQETGRVHSRR